MAIAPAGRGFEVLGVYGLFLALTTLTVGLRAYCRIRVQKAFGWDDWFAAIAWIFFVLHASFAITGVHHGTGQHAWDIKPASELPVGLKNWWLCEPVYVLSNMAIKASIAIMLLRLSVRPAHKTVLWITIIITELYSAFFFFLFIFQCIPSRFFWERFAGGSSGRCLDTSIIVGATYGYSAVTCVGDFVFSMLPVLLVWSLQMGRKEKGAVVLILAMGAIASIATIIRIPYIHTLADQEDFLYATTDIAIWSCSETGLGITAACCAVLRPLFRELLASSRFLSGNMSRMQTPTFSGGGGVETQKSANRRGFKRGSQSGGWQAFDGSRDFDEEEVTLQSLKTHGQKPGRDGKGFFGTTASVWADQQEESELEGGGGRDGEAAAAAGTSPLGRDIIVTRTRDVTLS